MFRAAVVQAAPVVFDLNATLDKVRQCIFPVRPQKAPGWSCSRKPLYPPIRKAWTLERVLADAPSKAGACSAATSRASIDVPGPGVDILSSIAREHSVFLVIGVIEREIGTLYCTVLFFDPEGALMGKHRKLMPTAMERLVWGMGDGTTLPVFDTPLGKVRSRDLLGELYAPPAHGDVFEGDSALLCPYG